MNEVWFRQAIGVVLLIFPLNIIVAGLARSCDVRVGPENNYDLTQCILYYT